MQQPIHFPFCTFCSWASCLQLHVHRRLAAPDLIWPVCQHDWKSNLSLFHKMCPKRCRTRTPHANRYQRCPGATRASCLLSPQEQSCTCSAPLPGSMLPSCSTSPCRDAPCSLQPPFIENLMHDMHEHQEWVACRLSQTQQIVHALCERSRINIQDTTC